MSQRFFLAIVLVGLSACGQATSSPPSAADGLHFVVDVQGHMSVQREGWRAYAPALLGTSLQYGDLLRVDEGAVVVCADLTRAEVPPGVDGVPCNVAEPVLTYKGSTVIRTRDDSSGEFPIVLAPRKTNLLNPYPTLRWTPVQGTTHYEVHVRGPGVDWRETVDSETEVGYPQNAPPLVPGQTYEVTVIAGTRSSAEEAVPGLGLTLLTPDAAAEVRAAETKVRALGLRDVPTRLLIANLYASQKLFTEAIEQLEAVSNTTQQPAVLRTLGDLYTGIGLNRLAEERYLQALTLSQQMQDIEGQALTQRLLGQIYAALGNPDEAVRRGRQALQGYQDLGATETVKEIETWLTQVQQP